MVFRINTENKEERGRKDEFLVKPRILCLNLEKGKNVFMPQIVLHKIPFYTVAFSPRYIAKCT